MYRKTQISFVEGMSAAANQWCVPDEVHDVLAADFDRSLSGLEVDLCTSSSSVNNNNMSSSVFAVPEISVRREESRNVLNSSAGDSYRCLQDISSDVVSNSSHGAEKCQIECYPVSVIHGKKIRYSQLTDIDCANSVKRFCFNKEMEHAENFQTARCRPHSLSAPDMSGHFYSSGSMINSIFSQVVQLPSPGPRAPIEPAPQQSRFHIVLLAPTSIATRMTEDTLTYLNQGQPYEIRIRKTGAFSEDNKMLYKSVIHVGFQERRLQYMEKEQIREWQAQRLGERILEIDIPLSYGLLEANNCQQNINRCEFLWDPCRDAAVFLKVNCISTEFTPKKHGGEKGVPFRILIETFGQDANSEKLHVASCQVKVFKPKGADRKHKTDRDKMCKRLQADKDKYHPQYEYTVFKDLPVTENWATSNTSSYVVTVSPTPSSPVSSQCNSPTLENLLDSQKEECCEGTPATSTTELQEVPEVASAPAFSLSSDSTAEDAALWLQKNMFNNFVKDFTHFTGADLLNLKRTDLIDICGLASGIRLYNNLHVNSVRPCLTVYVRLQSQKAFYAIYLETTEAAEFISKIKSICGIAADFSPEVYVSGPSGIHVIVTDEVIHNMVQESMFSIEYMNGQYEEPYGILLKQLVN